MKIEPQRTIRYYYLKFIRLKGDPSSLARGVAVGTFIGITPTIPFHTVMVLALALFLRGSKVAALIASVMVSNPLTFFPQYYLSWQIGNWLLPGKHSWEDISELINLIVNGAKFSEILTAFSHVSMNSLTVLIGGGIVLAIPFTALFYCLSYIFFRTIQKKRLEKKILK